MKYNRCGRSGLLLPAISLGLWYNFGENSLYDNCRELVLRAFDLGITHFDLANNYGPPAGAAEERFGLILRKELPFHRDELIISTKAGYYMWPGPYGEWGSRKYVLASLDQSLKRLGVEYVDIFYSHRFDSNTPIEETMGALAHAVRQGKALYAGISSYPPEQTAQAAAILRELGTPCLIHQPSYSMLNRWIEDGLQDVLEREAIGCIAFCPLAQGVLTGRYLGGVPTDSRATLEYARLGVDDLGKTVERIVKPLNELAKQRGQTLAQMALAWVLRGGKVTSALVGASRVSQIEENVHALANPDFTEEELVRIDEILKARQ